MGINKSLSLDLFDKIPNPTHLPQGLVSLEGVKHGQEIVIRALIPFFARKLLLMIPYITHLQKNAMYPLSPSPSRRLQLSKGK